MKAILSDGYWYEYSPDSRKTSVYRYELQDNKPYLSSSMYDYYAVYPHLGLQYKTSQAHSYFIEFDNN